MTSTDRDWPQDFPHENGNYENRCCLCEQTFVGHKRRVICRQCDTRARVIDATCRVAAKPTYPPENLVGTCDWGGCNNLSRFWRFTGDENVGVHGWLPVCERHKKGVDR